MSNLTDEQKTLLQLDDNEKIECYLQAFEYSDYWNRVEVLKNGKIRISGDWADRPRYYTQKGIVKLFDYNVKNNITWLLDAYKDRASGELRNKYI
jgi:hypothetical protein